MNFKTVKLLSAMIVSSIILMACSNPFDQLADEINSAIGSDSASEEETKDNDEGLVEVEEEASTAETDPMYEAIDYSHLYGEGEEITIDEGDYIAGEDIVPGRYRLTTTADHSAYLSIYNDEDRFVGGEVLVGENEDEATLDFPTEALFYIDEGNIIEVDSNQSFELTPAGTDFDEELSPGMYVAGHDIEAGDYRISTDATELVGFIETSAAPAIISSRNLMGNPEEGGKSSFVMTFDEGEIIEITRVKSVTIEKLD